MATANPSAAGTNALVHLSNRVRLECRLSRVQRGRRNELGISLPQIIRDYYLLSVCCGHVKRERAFASGCQRGPNTAGRKKLLTSTAIWLGIGTF